MVYERVRKAALEACQLSLELPLVAGISGGPDSLCLLHCLTQAGFRVVAAHFDHHLRPESGEDARKVASMAAERGLPFELGGQDVAAMAHNTGMSIEEAARTARYRFLFEAARRHAAQAVAVGHNADDQVETVLMHLMRGAGWAGLRGMSARSFHEGWDAHIPLARPLLGIWREEIEIYCQEQGLTPLMDATNTDVTFYRNRLRHELIPTLQGYNPKIKESLWRTAQVLSGDTEIYENAVETAWQKVTRDGGPDFCAFDLAELLALSLGLQRAVLRRGIAQLRPGLRDLDFETVERGLVFAARPSRSRSIDLALGLAMHIQGETLFLAEAGASLLDADWPQFNAGEFLLLALPGEVHLGGGWVLRADWGDLSDDFRAAGRWETWMDASDPPGSLSVRAARPGERFQPFGMHGMSQKLSDFFTNQHLSRFARENWPLVCVDDTVAWIAGYRLDERFRVRETSQRLIRIELQRSAIQS